MGSVRRLRGIGKLIPLTAAKDVAGNKKGRGNIAPTFLISLSTPVPVHPWSKVRSENNRECNIICAHQRLP
jgi:hypothetical protein